MSIEERINLLFERITELEADLHGLLSEVREQAAKEVESTSRLFVQLPVGCSTRAVAELLTESCKHLPAEHSYQLVMFNQHMPRNYAVTFLHLSRNAVVSSDNVLDDAALLKFLSGGASVSGFINDSTAILRPGDMMVFSEGNIPLSELLRFDEEEFFFWGATNTLLARVGED